MIDDNAHDNTPATLRITCGGLALAVVVVVLGWFVHVGRTTHFVIVFRRLLCRFVCQWRCGGVGSSIATVAACR